LDFEGIFSLDFNRIVSRRRPSFRQTFVQRSGVLFLNVAGGVISTVMLISSALFFLTGANAQ
jgi:hypothetical protein